MADVSDLEISASRAAQQARRLGLWARVVLVPVAVIGAVLSFRSLYQAAVPTFGDYLAAGFPLLVDLLILGASLQYVAGAKIGRPMAGWRLTAHAGVGGTLILNALAAKELGEVPWHVTAPAVWAVLVELTAKQVLGEWKATHTARADSISLPLWLTAPVESVRTRLLMFRTGITNAHQARIAVGVNAAAREALRLALPKRSARRVRRIINRQLRAGSLTPVAILRPLGWAKGMEVVQNARPDMILRAVLQQVLDPSSADDEVPAVGRQPADPEWGPGPGVVPLPPVARRPGPQSQAEPMPVEEFGAGQPGGRPLPPGRVQQPERALELGRALHRSRARQQAGPMEPPVTAGQPVLPEVPRVAQQARTAQQAAIAQQARLAQQMRMAQQLGTAQQARTAQPNRTAQPARSAQQADFAQQAAMAQAAGNARSAEREPAQSPRAQNPRFEPPRFVAPQTQSVAQPHVQQTDLFEAYERPVSPTEPVMVPTSVLDLDQAGEGVVYPGAEGFDHAEIFDDTDHMDELDGQEYRDDLDGVDYIDLNAGQHGETAPLGDESTESIRRRLAEARPS